MRVSKYAARYSYESVKTESFKESKFLRETRTTNMIIWYPADIANAARGDATTSETQ